LDLLPGVTSPPKLIHEVIPVGWLQCNCSIVGDTESREAIVIDPGDNPEEILAVLRRHRLKVKYIVITHAHIDHVGGAAKLKQVTGAPVLMHPEDRWLLENVELQAQMIGVPAPPVAELDQPLRAGDEIRWGRDLSAHVLHTPGHSPGSISLYLPEPQKILFAGDTLFAGSIGRTDLWGGSSDAILRSIHSHLLALDNATAVYPGHGPATTIGDERERNPFLQGL
jgi:glyoxylase-like metal-dependent hydrolase (beta-lactamase superfamily II)